MALRSEQDAGRHVLVSCSSRMKEKKKTEMSEKSTANG